MSDNPVSDKWARRIIAMWKWQRGFRGDNVRQTSESVYIGSGSSGQNAPPPPAFSPRQFRVKSEENDYLVCVPYDSQGDSAGETEYNVAKPPSFRGGNERWGVYPPYVAESSVIWAATVRRNGALDADSNPIGLMDLNFGGRSADGFWGLVGGSTSDTTNVWTYAITEQVPIAGGFADLDNGRSLAGVRNSIEDNNDGSGIQGNSADIDGPTFIDNPDLEVQPVQGSPVVWVQRYETSAGTYEYRFEYVNAVDGDCA